jgi:multimeric flavodoxin WrbA
MAMRVVAFVGSPRKGGNSDRLAAEILAGAAEAGHETERLYLTDYALTPIDAVYGGEENWTDPRQDPADELIARMVAADVVVLASPVYWFSISGLLKLFVDRWALYQRDGQRLMDLMPGKRMVVALALADPEPGYLDMVLGPLQQAAKWLRMEWAGEVVAASVADPGDLGARPEVLAEARALGRAL